MKISWYPLTDFQVSLLRVIGPSASFQSAQIINLILNSAVLNQNLILSYRIRLSGFFYVVSGDDDCSPMVDTLADKMIPNALMGNQLTILWHIQREN